MTKFSDVWSLEDLTISILNGDLVQSSYSPVPTPVNVVQDSNYSGSVFWSIGGASYPVIYTMNFSDDLFFTYTRQLTNTYNTPNNYSIIGWYNPIGQDVQSGQVNLPDFSNFESPSYNDNSNFSRISHTMFGNSTNMYVGGLISVTQNSISQSYRVGTEGSRGQFVKIDHTSNTEVALIPAVQYDAVSAYGLGNNNYGWTIGGHHYDNSHTCHYSWKKLVFADSTWIQAKYVTNWNMSTINRMDYSNDLFQRTTSNTYAMGEPIGSCNNDYGWFKFYSGIPFLNKVQTAFGGASWNIGLPFGAVSFIQRISFAQEDPAILTRATFPETIAGQGVSGNANYAWYSGGSTSIFEFNSGNVSLPAGDPIFSTAKSTVYRFDYANDTASLLTRAPRSQSTNLTQASGNQILGYHASGSKIDRINYSNDTTSPNPRVLMFFSGTRITTKGAWSQKQWSLPVGSSPTIPTPTTSGKSPSSYFYYHGGYTPNVRNWPAPYYNYEQISNSIRFDYSSDAAWGVPRGNTASWSKIWRSAAGNANYAWVNEAGIVPTSSVPDVATTAMDRMDYANDGATLLTRGAGSITAFGVGTGNDNYGWWTGGFDGYRIGNLSRSNVHRTDYANDLNAPSSRGPLAQDTRSHSTTEDGTNGYVYGGTTVGPAPTYSTIQRSSIQRISFSNDTVTASQRASIPFTGGVMTTHGNDTNAYIHHPYRFTVVPSSTSPSIMGTEQSYSTSAIYRYQYANDTTNASVRMNRIAHKLSAQSIGNNNYGYIGGGIGYTSPATVSPSTVYGLYSCGGRYGALAMERIDYSNDTLIGIRNYMSLTSGSTWGWPAHPSTIHSGMPFGEAPGSATPGGNRINDAGFFSTGFYGSGVSTGARSG